MADDLLLALLVAAVLYVVVYCVVRALRGFGW